MNSMKNMSTTTLKNESQVSIMGPSPTTHRKSSVMPATSMSHLADGKSVAALFFHIVIM